MSDSFSKRDSAIVKGCAILLMMVHHCFLSGRFSDFSIDFYPFTQSTITNFAAFSKICVSLFAFVSGYGMYCSLKQLSVEHSSQGKISVWIWRRYVRSFSDYWLVVVLSWVICYLIDGRTRTVYFSGHILTGFANMLIEFLGLSNLLGTPLLNGTWWYMSAAFVFIIIAPLLFSLLTRFGSIVCLSLVVIIPRLFNGYPGTISPLTFVPSFCLGLVCAHTSLFETLSSFVSNRKRLIFLGIISASASLIAFLTCFRLDTNLLWDIKWGLFPVIHIVFIWSVLAHIPGLKQVLLFLGKHSANIFMVHTFFRDTYLRNFIYSRKHFLLIILTLLALSLAASILFEEFKKIIRYKEFVKKLTPSL